jgi:hypothetical protein
MIKKSGIFFLALAAALFLAAPSFAGKSKKALSESDLDKITAAGEPTIIQVSGASVFSVTGDASLEVSFEDTASSEFTLAADSQTELKALTVNNVVGENQLANGINIASTVGGGFGAGTAQSNDIIQSWGSVKVTDVAITTEDEESSASADATIVNVSGVVALDKCVGFSCNSTADNSGQTATGAATASAVAIGLAVPIFMSADVIIHVEDVEVSAIDGDSEVSVSVLQDSENSLTLGSDSQTTLAALVVNNISGKNQVANGINIAGGSIALNVANLGLNGALQNVNATQSNTIQQYRGTPINAPQPIAVAIGASDGVVAGFALSGGPGAVVTIP